MCSSMHVFMHGGFINVFQHACIYACQVLIAYMQERRKIYKRLTTYVATCCKNHAWAIMKIYIAMYIYKKFKNLKRE